MTRALNDPDRLFKEAINQTHPDIFQFRASTAGELGRFDFLRSLAGAVQQRDGGVARPSRSVDNAVALSALVLELEPLGARGMGAVQAGSAPIARGG